MLVADVPSMKKLSRIVSDSQGKHKPKVAEYLEQGFAGPLLAFFRFINCTLKTACPSCDPKRSCRR